jgi:small conductance mechanosensitive channel
MTLVTGRTLGVVIWTAAFVMVLHELHFNVAPLIAGAGVVGVAIGFGAQSLIKDVLNGMFLLIENQLRINDVAVINGTGGLVEEINLRTTVLRGEDGAVHVFPNGSIQKLSNLTRDFSYAVFNVTVEYGQDLDRVMKVVTELAGELRAEEAWARMIPDPLEMLGVDSLADSGAVIKFRFRTAPMKQWDIAREMNRRLKRRFEETGIGLAFPSHTLYLAAETITGLREELRAVVREVLAEKAPGTD